jgi:hypothetical protein
MKGGSMFCRRSLVGEGRETNRCGLGWRGPALWASGVSESRQEGAAGRSTWTPVVGLADETSERGRLCGVSLVRSSRRQPSTTECPGGDDLPQGGVATSICDVAEQMAARTLESVNGEQKMTGGQNYSGAKLRWR